MSGAPVSLALDEEEKASAAESRSWPLSHLRRLSGSSPGPRMGGPAPTEVEMLVANG
jgi:hypothetical protein